MTLGERIAAARNRAGLTQLQLAQELGLQLFQVADWERGAAEPSLEQMAALCRVLGRDVGLSAAWARSPESQAHLAPRCGRVLEPGDPLLSRLRAGSAGGRRGYLLSGAQSTGLPRRGRGDDADSPKGALLAGFPLQ